jgi:hypothetical protein
VYASVADAQAMLRVLPRRNEDRALVEYLEAYRHGLDNDLDAAARHAAGSK